MEHDFFVGYVGKAIHVAIEGEKDCFSFSWVFDEIILFFLRVGSIEDDVVLAFEAKFISLNVAM